ncbi:MAG: hypothetical protein GXX92_12725 [Clostridiales bacterium]|nr:hypothetical protein [Clostridiales bacterium]
MYSTNPSKEKKFYVYFHRDLSGNIFYVGKGTGRRAWSNERHDLWKKYVEERLYGKFSVKIFRDGLSEHEAEELEQDLIDEYGERLVNWFNNNRGEEYEAIESKNRLRKENLLFVEETRKLESYNPEQAINQYREALGKMREYESIVCYKKSLFAELLAEVPKSGDWIIIDRLTICLMRIGRYSEAIEEAEKYFTEFPGIFNFLVGERLRRRVEKLRGTLKESSST